jgi:hypothetical protein
VLSRKTYLGQHVALVSVIEPMLATLEHAPVYPDGQIPGEKYAVDVGLHPNGKHAEVLGGPSWR